MHKYAESHDFISIVIFNLISLSKQIATHRLTEMVIKLTEKPEGEAQAKAISLGAFKKSCSDDSKVLRMKNMHSKINKQQIARFFF